MYQMNLTMQVLGLECALVYLYLNLPWDIHHHQAILYRDQCLDQSGNIKQMIQLSKVYGTRDTSSIESFYLGCSTICSDVLTILLIN
jgi:hypothetical protein